MWRGGEAAARSPGGGAMEIEVLPGVAAGIAKENAVPTAFGFDPAEERTTACGQPKRQHSCMQPVREACGIWQSMPVWCMAMGQ